MSWTCPSCGETFKAQCFHACGIPKRTPESSPLSPKRVRNPRGRVDVLVAHLLELGMKSAKDPALPALYQGVKPLVEKVLKAQVGPRTKRGRMIAANLFELQAAYERMQQQRGQAE
jgi:hypothetical protein